jgi:hypothetical protein
VKNPNAAILSQMCAQMSTLVDANVMFSEAALAAYVAQGNEPMIELARRHTESVHTQQAMCRELAAELTAWLRESEAA